MAARPDWLAIAALCLLPCVPGCGAGDDTVSPVPDGAAPADASAKDASVSDAPVDSSSENTPADANLDAAAGDGDAATFLLQTVPADAGLLRLANWSPNSPAVDACVALHGTGTFTGPIVAALAASEDASTTALGFPSVSAYVELAPGQYDVRFVVGGAATCATGIAGDATSLPSLAIGAAETVALVGESVTTGGDAPLSVVGFLDDLGASAVALRFVNAAPAVPSLDVGTGALAESNFAALFTGIPFGQHGDAQEAPMTDASRPADASSASDAAAGDAAPGASATTSSVDGNGYFSLKTLSNATLSAHAHGASTDIVSVSGVSAASGSVLTIAVIGDTSGGTPGSLLECVDNAGTVDPLSDCNVLP
ncbi:MAG TPA: DUF4397 domain-containing protein [Polyangiaceae bacterium]|nr:DUF4397 domain-containing protein [Polyangiaceae bacterium]